MAVPEEGHWFGSLHLVGRLPESVNFFFPLSPSPPQGTPEETGAY